MDVIEFDAYEDGAGGLVLVSSDGCIVTQVDDFEKLGEVISDAVKVHYDEPPKFAKIRFCRGVVMTITIR